MEFIGEIESRFPVDGWVIEGIHVWPLVRLDLAAKLLLENSACEAMGGAHRRLSGAVRSLLTLVKDVYGFVTAYFSDARGNARITGGNDAVFLTYSTDRICLQGRYYNRLADPLVELMQSAGLTAFILEKGTGNTYRYPRYYRSRYIQTTVLLAHVRSRVACRLGKALDQQMEGFDDFCTYLKSQGHGSLMPELAEISRQVRYLDCLKRFYRSILNALNPRFAAATDIFSLEGMALCLACREKGIPSVDIQHGLQGELHRAYANWDKMPDEGYELLPTIFWNWSDYEFRVIDKWSSGVRQWHKPVVGGNLWLNKWLAGDGEMITEYNQTISRTRQSGDYEVCILYTLQGFPVPQWVFEGIKKAPDSWLWMFRLHPCHELQKQEILELASSYNCNNIDVSLANELPLYALLRNVEVHMTGWSAVTVEAEHFGVPTIVTDRIGEEVFHAQLGRGSVTVAYDSEQLLCRVRRFLTSSRLCNIRQSGTNNQSMEALQSLLLAGRGALNKAK